MRLKNCQNIDDLRRLAKRKLPAPMYHYIAGGADDELTLRRNTRAFDDYELLPSQLNDVSSIDTSTRVLGVDLEWPMILSPTGMNRLFHHSAEPAVARAAAASGALYTLSTMATTTLEDIAAEADRPKMFQVYILRDRALTKEFVVRCKEAGYQALCLTVDTAIAGNRERDRVYGMTMPPRFSLASLFSFAVHVEWAVNFLLHPRFELANVAHRARSMQAGAISLIDYVNSQFDPSVTWDDAAWLVEQWDGPFVIKGLQSAADAKMAHAVGATGIMISNHGGRQLEGVPAAIDSLVPIREAVGNALELIVDGGVRRGTHIVKALALGADAVSIGRPYLYGLAAAGEEGVATALHILRSEFERSLALLGCSSVAELSESHIRR